ncbi:MAG: phosphatidate cytidylyltransferase, partial [Mycoplasmataceae bacterium]|nr:phosphatidate cytidylyltransferase [Mycoplasmataceae bacterium]
MIKSFIKKHPSSWRYISIAAILMIIFPVFFVVAYAGNVGAYIGLSAFILVGMYGLYEVFSNMNMSKLSVIYLSLLPLILFLFTNENVSPFSHFERVANSNEISNSSGAIYGSLKSLIQGSITWKNLLLLFIATLLPAVADPKIRKSGNAIRDQFIITVVTIIFSVFVKMTWLLNVFNYTWMFFFISIAIIADTFGYFGGKYLKKYIFNGAKLAPKISPKKT